MIQKKNILIIATFLFFILPYISGSNLYSVIWLNGSGGAYGDDNTDTSIVSDGSGNVIEDYIIESADYFTDSYSDMLSFSNSIESSSLRSENRVEMLYELDEAIKKIKSSINIVNLTINEAKLFPYNQKVLKKLKYFDYILFAETNRLNYIIFREVKSKLALGNITKIFEETNTRLSYILVLLERVKSTVASGSTPSIEVIWQLNELYSKTLLYGQYVARVFNAIQ